MGESVFHGGVPTEPDVKKLLEAFAEKATGSEITHEEVEQVLGISRNANRYRIVVEAWRSHQFKQNNIEIGALRGVGFKYLLPGERVDASFARFQFGLRQQKRSIEHAIRTPKQDLLPHQVAKVEHIINAGAAVVFQAQHMLRSAPAIALPSPKPPQQRQPPKPDAT